MFLAMLVGSDWGEVGCGTSRTAMKDGGNELEYSQTLKGSMSASFGLTRCLMAQIAARCVACDADGVELGRGWLWGEQNNDEWRSKEET